MRFLRLLKFIALSVYSTVNQAEHQTYDWDGIFPRAEWHGWVAMFGPQNWLRVNPGEVFVPGGWLDIKVLASLPITAKVTGVGAGSGVINLQFQGAMSLYDDVIRDEPSDMQFNADINGVNEVETHESIDVGRWNYIRFWSANNLSAVAVDVVLHTHDGVIPVELPEGTGV